MDIAGELVVVTGGASGLGLASVRRLAGLGAHVVFTDLPDSSGEELAESLGDNVHFVPADVTSATEITSLFAALPDDVSLRAVVHCAGRGRRLRILDKDGVPADLDAFEQVIRTNLIGSFNVLRVAAATMAKNQASNGERGVIVLTASIAAWEGQIGQIPYASSKAAIVGMTLVAARDLASNLIRVCTIAPGVFDTPLLSGVRQDVRDALGQAVPHPRRLGQPDEFAQLAVSIIENPMLNGETIRLDGALRMAPR